jgi:hypothetical protein
MMELTYRDGEYERVALATANSELRTDLREAQSELRRHHQDFQKIRDILDQAEATWALDPTLKAIRNVVG